MTEYSRDRTRRLEVFAAACSGSQRLAREIGLPVACLRAAIDSASAIEAMNKSSYAAWALWPEGFQPFKMEDGWCDWEAVSLGGESQTPPGVRHDGGRFGLDLPAHVTTAGFETALHTEFRRFAVAEVVATPRWLVAQCDAQRPLLVLPRYTLTDAGNFRGDTRKVEDLFVIYPALHVPPIAQAISRARTVAVRAADEALRHA